MTDVNTTEQLTLFGPEALAMMDKIDYLKILGDRYKALVAQHDRLATVMTGKVVSAEVDVTAFRHGSTRTSSNVMKIHKDDVQTVLEMMHQRILNDMREAFEKLQAHKDTI